MKNKAAIISLALVCLSAPAWGKSAKRGDMACTSRFNGMTCWNTKTGHGFMVKPGVGWYYNWANTPTAGINGQVEAYEGIDFVPMCWNANYSADKIRAYVKAHPECKYLLGFNEPNFTAQANMTPEVAAGHWTAVQALAKELNLKLVAPALNYSPNAPYQDPCKWMDEFVALVGPDAFDYTAIHVYGGYGVLTDLATKFHDKYGKDVWVTEFCYWPEAGNQNSSVTPTTQINFMTLDPQVCVVQGQGRLQQQQGTELRSDHTPDGLRRAQAVASGNGVLLHERFRQGGVERRRH